jgi:hypothetical protein
MRLLRIHEHSALQVDHQQTRRHSSPHRAWRAAAVEHSAISGTKGKGAH